MNLKFSALSGFKMLLLSVLAVILVIFFKEGSQQVMVIFKEQKITFVEYIWMQPLLLNSESLMSNVEGITSNYSVILFPLLMGCGFIVVVTVFFINFLIDLTKNILNSESLKSVLDVISGSLCWVLAWLTLNSLNQSWPIQAILQENILNNIDQSSYIFELIITVSFIGSLLYTVKAIFLATYMNLTPMSKYFSDKALGN